MNKTKQTIMMLITGAICFIVFFLTGNLVSLFLGISSIGMLLQIFGEKIISKIIIAVGGIGALVFAVMTFANVFKSIF